MSPCSLLKRSRLRQTANPFLQGISHFCLEPVKKKFSGRDYVLCNMYIYVCKKFLIPIRGDNIKSVGMKITVGRVREGKGKEIIAYIPFPSFPTFFYYIINSSWLLNLLGFSFLYLYTTCIPLCHGYVFMFFCLRKYEYIMFNHSCHVHTNVLFYYSRHVWT